MNYPGHIIKAGESDVNIVKSLKIRINEALVIDSYPGLRLNPNDPNDNRTKD